MSLTMKNILNKLNHYFLFQPALIFLFFGCAFGNPNEMTDTQKHLSILTFLSQETGSLNTALIAVDDQGADGNISSFEIISNGKTYTVNITYSSIITDRIQINTNSSISILGRLGMEFLKFFDSSLYAHTTSTSNLPGNAVYTTGENGVIDNFHSSNVSILTGAAFKSNPFRFLNIRTGRILNMTWHVRQLLVGGTITGAVIKNFEIRLPYFDFSFDPYCSQQIKNGSDNFMFVLFKMHNLFKDNTHPVYGKIVDSLYTSETPVNANSNSEFMYAVQLNLQKAFSFYGCEL